MSLEIIKPNGKPLEYLSMFKGTATQHIEEFITKFYFGCHDRFFICHLQEKDNLGFFNGPKGYKLVYDSRVIAQWLSNTTIAYCLINSRPSDRYYQNKEFVCGFAVRDTKMSVYPHTKIIVLRGLEQLPDEEELKFMSSVLHA